LSDALIEWLASPTIQANVGPQSVSTSGLARRA
jgi:hypothetical protein